MTPSVSGQHQIFRAPGSAGYKYNQNTAQVLTETDNNEQTQCEKFSRQLDLVLCRPRVKDAHILTDSVRNENILNVNYNHYKRIYTGEVLTVESVLIYIIIPRLCSIIKQPIKIQL